MNFFSNLKGMKFLYSGLVILFSSFNVFAGTIVIEGKYQNKNLYIQNSYSDGGVGFCAYEVIINGQVTTDEVASKTFEIDFSSLPIAVGSTVIVEIKHKNDCAPKVLNPEVLKPKTTFEMVDIKIDVNGLLSWSTINEEEKLPFIVEQFRWNKWIKVAEVLGNGKKGTNNYLFQTIPHSGENKFRVKQVGFAGAEKKSEPIIFVSNTAPAAYKVQRTKQMIDFSGETLFEIYDVYGNIIKYGYGKNVGIADLKKGSYFLCYDNLTVDFIKE